MKYFLLSIIIILTYGCEGAYPKEPPCYTKGWEDGYQRALKQYNIQVEQDKAHEGYTLDSLHYVTKYGLY